MVVILSFIEVFHESMGFRNPGVSTIHAHLLESPWLAGEIVLFLTGGLLFVPLGLFL